MPTDRCIVVYDCPGVCLDAEAKDGDCSINLPRRKPALPRLDARESTAIEIAN